VRVVLRRGDSVEGGLLRGASVCVLLGFWRVPDELEGEAVARGVVAVVVVVLVVVLLLWVVLLLLRLAGPVAQELDAAEGVRIHAGAGAARHARERLVD
jgi:hypothetical protein